MPRGAKLILKLGTRKSALAMAQSRMAAAALERAHPEIAVELIEITTRGDRKQGTALAGKGDKRDWMHELELGVTDGSIDFSVNSGKDMPAELDPATELIPVLKREDPRDVFIGRRAGGGRLAFGDVPEGAAIGTASLRRRAQLLHMRPDLDVRAHRGNVPTRLQKLEETPALSGIVLARAGIERLGLSFEGGEPFEPAALLPAVNQGILLAQVLRGSHAAQLLSTIVDHETAICCAAERACVERLQADCHSSVAIFAEIRASEVHLSARVLSADGSKCIEQSASSPFSEAAGLGLALADHLLSHGAAKLLEEARAQEAKFSE